MAYNCAAAFLHMACHLLKVIYRIKPPGTITNYCGVAMNKIISPNQKVSAAFSLVCLLLMAFSCDVFWEIRAFANGWEVILRAFH